MTNGFTADEANTIYSDVQMGLGYNAKTLAYWVSAYLTNRVANEGPGSEAYIMRGEPKVDRKLIHFLSV